MVWVTLKCEVYLKIKGAHLIPSMTMKKRRAARTKMRQKRIQIAKAVRPVASEGVACQNYEDEDFAVFGPLNP